MISFIVAMDENRVIGKDNQLPWHLPEDLKFFKKVTMGHPVAMGRKTHESIGRLLPGRENIIITRDQEYKAEGTVIFTSIPLFLEYIEKSNEEVFVIGGAEIFSELLPYADRLYVTRIYEKFEGDTYFPEVDYSKWDILFKEKGPRNEKNNVDYEFFIYEKK